MFKRTLFAAVSAATMLASAVIPAFAWPGSAEGCPALTSAQPVGYYICHDERGTHLRTHGPGDEHNFTARLTTDGVFENVDTVRLESRDGVAVTDGGHTLLVRFHTYNWIDGVNFRVRGGDRLRFALELDGAPIATDSIYLGPDGTHPDTNPFTIHR